MDKERVKELIHKNRLSLLDKESASINLIELFEITEHLANNAMGDLTPVTSCYPEIIRPINWISLEDFAKKYNFIHWATVYDFKNYDDDFKSICEKRKGKVRKTWHVNEKAALQFFLKLFENKDTTHPFILERMAPKIEMIKSELKKL